MKEPKLSDLAKNDLAEIWATIAAARDEQTAERMTGKILAKCRTHVQFPETGRRRDEIIPGLRSFPVRPYVVFFRAEEGTILVLRILHGRRDVEAYCEGRLGSPGGDGAGPIPSAGRRPPPWRKSLEPRRPKPMQDTPDKQRKYRPPYYLVSTR